MKRWWLIFAVLGGCSWMSDDKGFFVDRGDDYLDVQENPPLQIPDDLAANRVADPFPIPEIAEPIRPQYFPGRLPRPDAIYANDNRDEVRMQRLGDRQWLVIPEPPTTVWPKVKQFLAENGVEAAWEAPGSGRLDTDWLVVGNESYRDVIRLLLRDSREAAGISGGRDRLRIRVEQGLRERTSEVHVRHENDGFSQPAPDDLVDLNRETSHIAEAEKEMLNELGAYVAARVAEQTVSMVAQDIGSPVKSFLDRDPQGEPVLRLLLDGERAWATVGQSLARADIPVTEADERARLYRIEIPEDLEVGGEEKGFFGRLFSFGDDDKVPLQLHLREAADGTYLVEVLDQDAQHLSDREFSQQVLVLVREYAS